MASRSMDVLRLLGTLMVVTSVARGFVAFAAWRQSLVNRLVGAEPGAQEVS